MNPLELMLEVIQEHTPTSKWYGTTLEPFRQVANTNRGDIGEEFIFRYLSNSGITVGKGVSRIEAWDLEVGNLKFEVKTASEEVARFSSTTSVSTGITTTCSVSVFDPRRYFSTDGGRERYRGRCRESRSNGRRSERHS